MTSGEENRMVHAFRPDKRRKTLSLMPTFRCTAECQSCGTLSSPRAKGNLNLEQVTAAIEEAATLGYECVVFTGGEATLEPEIVFAGIQQASERGMTTRLVTNAWWAVDESDARRYVGSWVEAGLKELNFSSGDQHVRFVSPDNVVRGIVAAVEHGLPVGVMIEIHEGASVTKATITEHPDFASAVASHPSAYVNIIESPWMPLKPMKVARHSDARRAANHENILGRPGCDSVLQTTTVQADGSIVACCGIGSRLIPELKVGSVSSTGLAEADAAAESDFLKHWISVEGPERILDWASSHDPSIEWEDMYAHRCQACLRVYTDPSVREIVATHYLDKVADVMFGEWLLRDAKLSTPSDEDTVS